MTLTFSRESYGDGIEDVKRLLPIHWEEMAQRKTDIPLDPNYALYEGAMGVDLCRAYLARDDGELVGYAIFWITPRHTHYAHRWAKDDTIWVKADSRRLGVATGLFDLFEADLAKDGPIVVQIETRFGHPELEWFVERRGYEPTGKVYGRRFA